MNPQLFLFIPLALIAIITALGMLLSKNTVYSALHLIVNFASVAMLYLMLGAPFIALAQVTVYAGAIMVLFLFVIMLLGVESQRVPVTPTMKWQRPAAIGMGVILLIETALMLIFREQVLPPAVSTTVGFGSPSALAETLFTSYLLPFEVTSLLLLVAMIGAIVLTRRRDMARTRRVENSDKPATQPLESKLQITDENTAQTTANPSETQPQHTGGVDSKTTAQPPDATPQEGGG
jgi:NADH-quinone oxidoreductase subunit J